MHNDRIFVSPGCCDVRCRSVSFLPHPISISPLRYSTFAILSQVLIVATRTKLKIDYRTREPDPVNPDRWIESTHVRNRYGKKVDWTNKTSVIQLNAWREQILRRNFSKVRKVQINWTHEKGDADVAMGDPKKDA